MSSLRKKKSASRSRLSTLEKVAIIFGCLAAFAGAAATIGGLTNWITNIKTETAKEKMAWCVEKAEKESAAAQQETKNAKAFAKQKLDEVYVLKQKQDSLIKANNAEQASTDSAKASLADEKAQNTTLENKLGSTTQQAGLWQAKYNNSQDENVQLRKEIGQLYEANDQLKEENGQLREQNGRLVGEVEAFKAQIVIWRGRYDSLSAKVERFSNGKLALERAQHAQDEALARGNIFVGFILSKEQRRQKIDDAINQYQLAEDYGVLPRSYRVRIQQELESYR